MPRRELALWQGRRQLRVHQHGQVWRDFGRCSHQRGLHQPSPTPPSWRLGDPAASELRQGTGRPGRLRRGSSSQSMRLAIPVLGILCNWTLHQPQRVKSRPDEESQESLTHASGPNPESLGTERSWGGKFSRKLDSPTHRVLVIQSRAAPYARSRASGWAPCPTCMEPRQRTPPLFPPVPQIWPPPGMMRALSQPREVERASPTASRQTPAWATPIRSCTLEPPLPLAAPGQHPWLLVSGSPGTWLCNQVCGGTGLGKSKETPFPTK